MNNRPYYKKVVVIGAHPDDFEFGCGAFLSSYLDRIEHLSLVIATTGGVGGDQTVRRKEQLASESILREFNKKVIGIGSINTIFLDFQDTELIPDRELIKKIEEQVNSPEADLVLCHYPQDTHQDHRALGLAVQSSCRYHPNVWFYQSYTSQNFNPVMFFPFGEMIMNKKIRLMEAHVSQIQRYQKTKFDMKEAAITSGRYMAFLSNLPMFAEGFVPHRVVVS